MDQSRNLPQRQHHNSANVSPVNEPVDWSSYEFFSIDSSHTVRFEDAIHISTRDRTGQPDSWHMDLKVVHPLPLEDKASLREGEPSLCLGFADQLRNPSKLRPSLSLVVATNSCRLIDSEVASIPLPRPDQRRNGEQHRVKSGSDPAEVVEKLTLLRAAALRVSFFKDRELRPEHAVNLIMTYAQQRALEIVRDLPQSPPLVVLRSSGSRVLNQKEARKLGFAIKSPLVEITAGSRIPTVVRSSEPVKSHDALRMKQNSLSGLINSVQISCALLAIEPIPVEMIEGLIPETSQQDKLKHMTTVPQTLRSAIEERQRAIREVLGISMPRPPQ
jgi:hypothetical protein